MSKMFYHVMQDNVGNLLFNVSGTMRIAGSGTLATIYGDEALTAILPNPMTNHPSYGSFKCFLGVGDYDFYMAKSGYSFETLTGVQGSGTMADQNASAVTITGGDVQVASCTVGGGGSALASGSNMRLFVPKNLGIHGVIMLATGADAGSSNILFLNAAATVVGSIGTSATATTYSTTSDARLKHAIAPLTGALGVVTALRPISHRWKADDSPGVGFLAHEVQEVVDGVITGDRDAVNDAGQIVPQMIDYAKLVPWLVSACQDLAQQIEALTARLETARP